MTGTAGDPVLCVFYVGSEEYAVDVRRVDEVTPPSAVTALPGAPRWVLGVMNHRGELVPVVDARARLGPRGEPPPRVRPKWLVVLVGARRVALSVDGVAQVVRVKRSELQPLPALARASENPAVVGAFGPAQKPRLLLDVKALLR